VTGLEPATFRSTVSGATAATDSQDNTSGTDLPRPDRASTKPTAPTFTADPDLDRLIEAWPDLPPHIRAAVLALLGTAY
jgi:hypothetical protein